MSPAPSPATGAPITPDSPPASRVSPTDLLNGAGTTPSAIKAPSSPSAVEALSAPPEGTQTEPNPPESTPPAPLPAATSTRTVTFSVSELFCPRHGLYGISYVTVTGADGMSARQRFIWQTKAAGTAIEAVPADGAQAQVTVTYRCNTKVLWWYEAGAARQTTASLWIPGSGPQPEYTLEP